MILCQCVGVTDTTIKQLIADGATSVPEITRRCGAGRCCVPCRDEIAALLYRAGAAPHTSEPQQNVDLRAWHNSPGERSGA